jgi:two-component system sensor histidine kinase VicK
VSGPSPEDIQSTLSALEGILLDKDSGEPPAVAAVAAVSSGPSKPSSGRSAELLAQAGSVVMIDGVAHDLRSPLTAIILYVEHLLIGQGGPLNEEQARVLHVVTESTKRLANFINNLLDLNRVSQGRLEVHMGEVEMGPLVEDIVELHRVVAEKKRVGLSAEIAPDLPKVSGGREKIEQVLINVMSNALKFTPAGGQVSVSVAARDDRWIQVSVRDTGSGIAPEELPQLFRTYAELDSEHRLRLVRGTGLGLLISREIIDAHGGQIWGESVPGAGTTVYFALPIDAAASGN